jgi:RNA polymerase sigma-70 factor (ECF subfamily)
MEDYVSNALNYEGFFQSWEIAIAKKLANQFRKKNTCLKRGEFNDLLQEVLIHWYLNKDKYNSNREASERTFMAKVVRNKLKDILREIKTDKRTSNYQTIPLDLPLGDDESCSTPGDVISENDILSGNNITSDPFSKISLKIDLEKALQKLHPIPKKICNLIIKEGLNVSELSEYLNTPRSTIYDEIKRIRKIFEKEHLKNY